MSEEQIDRPPLRSSRRANRFADTAALFQALGGTVTPPPK